MIFLRPSRARALSYPDARVVTCSWDRTLGLWELATGTRLQLLQGHEHWVRTAHVSPAEPSQLLSGGGDHTVRLWDLNTGQNTTTLQGHQNWVRIVRFSPSSPHLAVSAGWDDASALRLWDTRAGSCVHSLTGHAAYVRALAHAPAASAPLVWSGDAQGVLLGHDLRGGSSAAPAVRLEGHSAPINALALHGDGTLLSGGSDGKVKVWDTTTGGAALALGDAGLAAPRLTFAEHSDWVSSVAVAPDRTVISVSGDGRALIWDMHSGQVLSACQASAAALACCAGADDETTLLAYGLANGQLGTVTMPSRDEAATDAAHYRKSEAAAAVAAARAASANVGLADWFLKKGGWKMVS